VKGITRTHEEYLMPSALPASASLEAAASAAAHQALVNLFPASVSSCDSLYAAILAAIPDSPHKPLALYGANSLQTKFSRHGRTTAQMRLWHHLAAAGLVRGWQLPQLFFPTCCRNGDSSRHLE
jgi:hypothetical protein